MNDKSNQFDMYTCTLVQEHNHVDDYELYYSWVLSTFIVDNKVNNTYICAQYKWFVSILLRWPRRTLPPHPGRTWAANSYIQAIVVSRF